MFWWVRVGYLCIWIVCDNVLIGIKLVGIVRSVGYVVVVVVVGKD